MGASSIVEGDVAADAGSRFGHTGVGPEVDLLVLYASSQALNEDVVAPRSFSVHADLDLPGGQNLDEVG